MPQANGQAISVTGGRAPATGEGPGDWLPPVDIVETETAFEIAVELCGVSREDVRIGFEEGRLTVWGRRQPDAAGETLHYRERRVGRFVRAFSFRTPVDGAGIAASLRQGVLTLNVPKKRARKIPLESGA